MRFFFCVIVILLLIVGCESSEQVNEMAPEPEASDMAPEPTPENNWVVEFIKPECWAAVPSNVDWELIATLQRNPLKPGAFYIFPEQKEAINVAYREGKHFIFEIGREYKEDLGSKIRHYIIQPEIPYQDKDKNPLLLHYEKEGGFKDEHHRYFFISVGWYASLRKDL